MRLRELRKMTQEGISTVTQKADAAVDELRRKTFVIAFEETKSQTGQ